MIGAARGIGIVIAAALLAMLGACSKTPEKVSFSSLEEARATARSNAEFNAAKYRADNPRFDVGFTLVGHGDTSQTNECPQGDGWATLSLMKVEGKQVEKYTLKCSTVSSNLGCYLDADFAKKPQLAQDDGRCQPVEKVPYPLPRIGEAKKG